MTWIFLHGIYWENFKMLFSILLISPVWNCSTVLPSLMYAKCGIDDTRNTYMDNSLNSPTSTWSKSSFSSYLLASLFRCFFILLHDPHHGAPKVTRTNFLPTAFCTRSSNSSSLWTWTIFDGNSGGLQSGLTLRNS